MLYIKHNRTLTQDASLVKPTGGYNATVNPSSARESASSVRHEYIVGGDLSDNKTVVELLTLADQIRRKRCSTAFVIVPPTYTRNGVMRTSDRAGAILYYSDTYCEFGYLEPKGLMVIAKGQRAGESVHAYQLVVDDPENLPNTVKWFKLQQLMDRAEVDKSAARSLQNLSTEIREAFALGYLVQIPAWFKPAFVDNMQIRGTAAAQSDGGAIDGRDEADADSDLIDELNKLNPSAPDDDSSAPF